MAVAKQGRRYTNRCDTLKRGARVARSMPPLDRAQPSLVTNEIFAPSNAGPGDSMPRTVARCSRARSQHWCDVDKQRQPHCGEDRQLACGGVGADGPARHGRRTLESSGNPAEISAVVRMASALARVNGAWPAGRRYHTMWA